MPAEASGETAVLLVRHGSVPGLGERLYARTHGLGLTAAGMEEARRLAGRLAREGVQAIYSSPLQRARETAAAIAEATGLEVAEAEAIIEVDFGGWTGQAFAELERDAGWRAFNACRTLRAAPGGESLSQVLARVTGWLSEVMARHPGERVVAVSHADVIRTALAGLLGASLDMILRLEISPASITEVRLGDAPPRVVRVNDTAWCLAPNP